MTDDQLPSLSISQIKVGDVLVRDAGNNGFAPSTAARRVVVRKVTGQGPTHFMCKDEGQEDWHATTWYGTQLSAQGFGVIERGGRRIGRFLVKYW